MKNKSKRYKELIKISASLKTNELKDVIESVKKLQPQSLMSQ